MWNRYKIGSCCGLLSDLLLLSFNRDLIRAPLKGDEVLSSAAASEGVKFEKVNWQRSILYAERLTDVQLSVATSYLNFCLDIYLLF